MRLAKAVIIDKYVFSLPVQYVEMVLRIALPTVEDISSQCTPMHLPLLPKTDAPDPIPYDRTHTPRHQFQTLYRLSDRTTTTSERYMFIKLNLDYTEEYCYGF